MSDDLIQGSPEWFAERAGKATASRIADIIAKTKTGWGASRANYAAQLVAERLTGQVQESFSNAAMKWGTDMEPEARSAYAFHSNVTVGEIGFVPHPRIPMSGASPDGLVADNGLVEIKCPNTASHIETLLGQNVPAKYLTQMQWQMACTDRSFCDFVSYDPRLPETMRLFVRRVPRDQGVIRELETEVSAFLAGVAKTLADLRAVYEQDRAA
jgi:putative phage-type endonuclease